MNSTQSIILNGHMIKQEAYVEPMGVFYEVMRLMDGALLFYEDHFERLKLSLSKVMDAPQITIHEFMADIRLLLITDGVKNQNIKYVYFNQMGQWTRATYYIPSHYPNSQTYLQGVHAKSIYFERSQPDVKQMSQELTDIRHQMSTEGVFDFLCLNSHGFISEGTKTNIFVLKDNKLFTAPEHEVLGGITRLKVLEFAKSLNLEIHLQSLSLQEALNSDAIFFTGTSIGILPISRLDDHLFEFNKIASLKSLMKLYQMAIADYQIKKPILIKGDDL